MNMWLLEFLIKAFTKPGDTVLDPMAGSGSTSVVAAIHGRNAVQVELEKKFYEWMEKARENVEKHSTLTVKGWIKNICGDARRLSELLSKNTDVAITSPPYSEGIGHDSGENASEEYKERLMMQRRYTRQMVCKGNIAKLPHGDVDVAITSPPYSSTYVGGGNPEKRKERLVKAGHNPKDFLGGKARNAVLKHYDEVDVCLTSPPYSESMTKKRKGYTVFPELQHTREMPQDSSDDNIANLPHGSIDLVLTSPPYADVEKRDRSRESWFNEDKERDKAGGSVTIQKGYRGSPENIGNLSLGNVDAVITSPPYGEAQEGSGIAKRGYQGSKHSPTDLVGKRSYMPDKFENPENISRLPLGNIDTIITSPPYQNALHDSLEKREAWESRKLHEAKKGLPVGYSENTDNIGNIKKHGSIDVILTSPPYADGKKAGEVKPEEVEKYAERWEENVEKRDWNSWGKSFHTPGRLRGIQSLRDGYSNSKKNIGNLPFGQVDTIITSPPYSNIAKSKEGAISPHMQGLISKLSGIPLKDFAHNIEKLKEAVEIAQSKIPFKYGDSPNNIGNLPLGNIDCCITSPPYEGSLEGTTRHTRGGIASRDPALAQTGTYATRLSFGVPVGYSPSKDNIGNLKSSDEEYQALVDTVITSPPYAHESTASKPTKFEKQGLFKMGHSKEEPYTKEDYRTWIKHKNGNISKRKLFIRIPCKPEEAQFRDTREGRKGTIWEWTKEVEATPEIIEQMQKLKSEKKGKSETYLEAMLKVYGEMFRVLKPGGLAIVVVKPFIRKKRAVDLPWHTWLLMAKVGFNLAKLYKLRIRQHSFWRILQYRKFPEVPIIAHEYVLVCQKPSLEPVEVGPQVDPFEFLLESVARKKVSKIAKNLHK
jgi:hypothetical protein